MSESERVKVLESEIKRLQTECDLWKRTTAQLTQTVNRMVNTFIIKK